MRGGFAPYGAGFEEQHDAQFRQQAPDPVEGGGALLDKALVGAAHHELALLLDGFDGHEAHLPAADRFADGGGVGHVVLAAFAREAVGSDELGGHQAHSVAEVLKLTRPVVGARAGFHAHQARGQCGDKFQQLVSRHAGTHQCRFARCVHGVHGAVVLGRSMPTVTMVIDFPFHKTSGLMRDCTSHRGTLMPTAQIRAALGAGKSLSFVKLLETSNANQLTRAQTDTALPLVATGFEKYQWLQQQFIANTQIHEDAPHTSTSLN